MPIFEEKMTAKVIYKGDLRTEAIHVKSGISIITDAPTDNHGKGEAFSPTDLLATSLGSCMLTVMGIAASRINVDMDNAEVEVTKIMSSEAPRRVIGIKANIILPKSIMADEKNKKILENAALTCPVAKSLHPDLQQEIVFEYR